MATTKISKSKAKKKLGPTMARIVKEMEEQNISQAELADRIFVTHVTVFRWVNGIRDPKITDVERMCKVLGLNILVYK